MQQLTKHQLVNVEQTGFLKEQLLFFCPSIFILVAGLIVLMRPREFKNFRFLLWTEVFTLTNFTWFQAKGYYAIGLYPILLAFGSVWIERLINKKQPSDSVISFEMTESVNLETSTKADSPPTPSPPFPSVIYPDPSGLFP